ncbi:MAG: hypothetical protein JNK30_18000 [Phenylobacterium sp.]|uniref:hypothetical protein n=1 Tax=Phenylobacterium sp. TaxID=1871053 RepID=UPI001A3E79D5|nr:hypothetical protein [Phenylobacterium sp.]MBL8773281.1 hypothetical protein [Phenylobacterium sp.]
MAIERVTERTDGLTSERVVERDAGGTTYVDTGRGSGMGGVIIGIAVLAMVAIIAFFLLQSNRNDALRTEAVTSAASSVADSASNAAEGVAGAADRAADAVTPN